MPTLSIKDLDVTIELSRKELAAVRGGYTKTVTYYNGELVTEESTSPSPAPANEFSFDPTNALGQCQDLIAKNSGGMMPSNPNGVDWIKTAQTAPV